MKKFLSVTGYVLLTLLSVASVVWIAKVPVALAVCNGLKRNVRPDECIKTVAVRLTSPKLCDEITGRDFEFENPPKQECLTDIAVQTNDIELCAKVEGGFISQTEFTCRYKVAVANKNAAACASLEGSESRIGIVNDKSTCFAAIGKTEADAASAPPKKGPAPIVAGLGAGTLDLIAYALLGGWALWTIMGIVKRARRKNA